MYVSELIAKLQTLRQDLEVLVYFPIGEEDHITSISDVTPDTMYNPGSPIGNDYVIITAETSTL
jgi:hypothetical protein